MKRITCLILLSWVLTAIAFTSYGQDDEVLGRRITRTSALVDLQNIVQSVATFRDKNASALSLAKIADVWWNREKDYSRTLFDLSLTHLEKAGNETPKESSQKATTRRKVIALIAKRDPVWARQLVELASDTSKKKAKSNLDIAEELLETDPSRASDFANRSIEQEVTPGLVSFLKKLRQQDADRANSLFLKILTQFLVSPNKDGGELAILGTYVFRSARLQADDSTIVMVRIGNIGMPDFSADHPGVPGNLVYQYIRTTISLIGSPTTDSNQKTLRYALGYQLIPKAQGFGPDLVSELMASLASLSGMVPQEYTTEAAYKNLEKKASSPEERIKEIEKLADTEVRDQLFADIAFQSYRKGNFEIARLAISKVQDESLKEELEALVLFAEIAVLLDSKQPEAVKEGIQRIVRLQESFEKSLLWLSAAEISRRGHDVSGEQETLGYARHATNRHSSQMNGYVLLSISGQLAKRSSAESGAVFAEAIRAFNKVEKVGDPILEHKVEIGNLSLRFPLSIGAVKAINLDFQTSFTAAARADENSVISIIGDLDDERLRGNAYVSLSKLLLEGEALTINTPVQDQAVVRVREDGIRKSAIKTVHPVFPAKSVQKKSQGVAVVELQYNGKGVIEKVSITESPDEMINKAVLDAVRQWKFKPSQLDGKPISVRGKLTFYFTITNGKAEVKNPKQFQ